MTFANSSRSRRISDPETTGLPAFLAELIRQGGKVYEVGGPVRDRLMDHPRKDHDLLVCKLSLQKVRKILSAHGDVFQVGRAFGILKFYPQQARDIDYDIALPRKEKSTGTGHRDFDVTFDPELPVEDDLWRRDFTINAMALEYGTGKLIDPFGGKNDLNNAILRQVNPHSFVDDPLRILRAVQFAARFHLKIEEETWNAMTKHASLIQTVSAERISEEIGKLLTATKPSAGFNIMRNTGILKFVFPELDKTVGVDQGRKLENDDVFTHTMRVLDATREDEAIPFAGDLELMLAALFHDLGKPRTKRYDKKKERLTFYGHQALSRKLAERRMRELKMTTLGISPINVGTLIEHHMFQAKSFFSEKAVRRFIRSVGEDLILKLIDLRIADNRGGRYPEGIRGVQKLRQRVHDELEKKPAISVSDLAINGHDLMAIGIPEGPEIGHILKNLLEVVLDDPSHNNHESLMKIVRETLGYDKKGQSNAKKGPANKGEEI